MISVVGVLLKKCLCVVWGEAPDLLIPGYMITQVQSLQ